MNLSVKQFVNGNWRQNCYIVSASTGECLIIDPGSSGHEISQMINEQGLQPLAILNTHGHFDHSADNKRLKEVTGAQLLIHPADASMILNQSMGGGMWGLHVDNSPPPDRYLGEGDIITFGDISLKVLHTPGHSPGGISLVTDKMVFVGDTLFAGSIGRTDFPGGDYEGLLRQVRDKIFTLGDDVVVYPGHGPKTTVGRERKTNPFFSTG